MNTAAELQDALEQWNGQGDPPPLSTVTTSKGYRTLSPAGRVQAINQAQRNWADRLYAEDPVKYGETLREVEQDFNAARRTELEQALAEDLRTGALSDSAVKKYVTGGLPALVDEGEAGSYVAQRYGRDEDVSGPWVTQKMPLAGADGKQAGYSYVRHAPGRNTVEVSYALNASDGRIFGTEDVPMDEALARPRYVQQWFDQNYAAGTDTSGVSGGMTVPAAFDREYDEFNTLPDPAKPFVYGARAAMARLQQRPEIVQRMGQGGLTAAGGEAMKGFLTLGAAATYGPAALFGSTQAAQQYGEAQRDINSDFEGMSRAGFAGGMWNDVATGLAREAIPTALSMGTSAVASALRNGVSSAVGRNFLARMAAMELDNMGTEAAKVSAEKAAKMVAAELLGGSAGLSAKQALHASLARGVLGKAIGTAPLESRGVQMLADRVTNALAFLPSSARSGLDNMLTTLNEADDARKAGDEVKAQALEDRAVMNNWAGTLTETLSENMWLNEMLVTRAGPLSRVATDVLSRRMKPGAMSALTQRARQALEAAVKSGAQEGTEEVAAGVGGRAWMNEFAAQNKDLLEGMPQEFVTGAVMGSIMGGAKGMAENGKPQVLAELTRRGLDGDPAAQQSLANIRALAENKDLPGKRAAGAQSSPTVDTAQGALVEAPGMGAAQTEEAASAPAPVVPSSDVTRLPALMDPAGSPSRGGLLEALIVEDPEEGGRTDRTDGVNDFAGVPEASGPADLLQPEGEGLLVSPPPAPAPSFPSAPAEGLRSAQSSEPVALAPPELQDPASVGGAEGAMLSPPSVSPSPIAPGTAALRDAEAKPGANPFSPYLRPSVSPSPIAPGTAALRDAEAKPGANPFSPYLRPSVSPSPIAPGTAALRDAEAKPGANPFSPYLRPSVSPSPIAPGTAALRDAEAKPGANPFSPYLRPSVSPSPIAPGTAALRDAEAKPGANPFSPYLRPSVSPSPIAPGTAASPPVPDTAETVAEQARLAADRNSTRRAVLITPGTPRPQKTPGLKGVKTPHGLLLYNPKKVPLKEAMSAARAEVFDARILGMSEAAKFSPEAKPSAISNPVAVTASTPAAPNVQAELVTDPAALPAAVAAAQAAAPGAVVEVKPASQVLEERGGNAPTEAQPVKVRPRGRAAQKPVEARQEVQQHMAAQPVRAQADIKKELIERLETARAALPENAASDLMERKRQAEAQWKEDAAQRKPQRSEVIRHNQRMRNFDKAIEREMSAGKGTVEIRIPGDGTFTIDNSPAALDKMIQQAKKLPVKNTPVDAPMVTDRSRKPQFEDYGQENPMDPAELDRARKALARLDTEISLMETWVPSDAQMARSGETAYAYSRGYAQEQRDRVRDRELSRLREARALVATRVRQMEALQSDGSPSLRPSVSPSSSASPAPTTKHGESAIRILGSKAPEIVKDLRVVANVGELNPADYTPAQWAGIREGGTEGFFHPASGQSVVILDNIQPRAGESPVRAVARVILHERLGHAGLGVLRRSDAQFARRWADLVARIPAEELMAIASESGYAGIASDEQSLAEEWLARHAERVKLEPPGSPLRQLWDALVAAVRRLMSAFSPGGMTAEQLAGSLLKRSRKALARQTVMPDGAVLEGPMMHSIRAHHGTPHKVDKFRTEKIGTGEGAQAYGWGLYFAESEGVARNYQEQLRPRQPDDYDSAFTEAAKSFISSNGNVSLEDLRSAYPSASVAALEWGMREARGQERGNLYTVELLPDADEFLDWDKPLSEQSEKVQAAIRRMPFGLQKGEWQQSGQEFYGMMFDEAALVKGRNSPESTSQFLADFGIPGIRYLDGNSRDGGSGTSNYVIFDEKLVKILEENGQPVGPAQDDIRFSRAPKGPLEVRDLPEWAKRRLGLNVPSPYRVQGQAVRRILKGDALPKGWGDVLAKAGHEVDGILSHMGTLAADMQRAMKSYAKASGQALEQVERAVQIALTGDRLRILPAGAVRESAVAVRSFLDGLSAQVAAITGGDLGKAILDNRGHWMRRSYLAFDEDADWNYDTLKAAADKGKALHGRDAKAILARAEKFLQAQNPTATPAALEALMRDLTDRNALADVMAGTGPRVTKEVTSLMRRRAIPKALRDLMGEVRDPFANAVGSVKFQAQFIARHDQQQTLARIGLASGLISHKREGVYKEQLGDGTQRWSGFYAKTASGKTVPLYTTPELMQAMQSSPAMGAQDVGHAFLRGIQALNGIAKANKVALNPDSMAPQYFGNVVSLIMGGDLLWLDGWKNMAEAVRIYRSGSAQDVAALKPVEKALLDSRRQMLARMTAAGVVNSASLDDLRATLDTAMLKFSEAATAWDRTAGFAHGALLGQSFGRTFGAGGRLIGAAAGAAGGAVVGEQAIQRAFHKIAQWAVGHPDRVGKMTSFLTNLEHELAAGTPDAAAVAAGKTLDTLPAYEKIPQLLRNMSKYSMLGSFMAFKYETLRNAYHNVRLGVQEIRSGNAPLVRRGVRRLAGTAAVASLLGWGIPALGGLIGKGLGDDEDKAYRQWLGAPWEKDALLTFTHFDGEKASFFNSGYLIPQGMIVEWARSAQEDGFDGLMGKAWQDFAEGSVVLDPLLDALRNSKKDAPERPVSYKDGYAGFLERLDYAVQRILEPGAADKLMRVRRAVMNEPTAGRSFSTQEEMLRLAGFRSYTYDHQPRIASTLYRLNEEKQKIAAEARTRWKSNRPGERATAVPDANARMEALDAEAAEFTRAMKLLKLPAETRTPAGDRLRFKPGVRLRDSAAGPVVR